MLWGKVVIYHQAQTDNLEARLHTANTSSLVHYENLPWSNGVSSNITEMPKRLTQRFVYKHARDTFDVYHIVNSKRYRGVLSHND